MNFVKKYYWLIVFTLYIVGVLALLGVFLLMKEFTGEAIHLRMEILKALVVGVFPILFPVFYKIRRN